MVYDTQITIVTGVYKPINITGGPHIVGNPQGSTGIHGERESRRFSLGKCRVKKSGAEALRNDHYNP